MLVMCTGKPMLLFYQLQQVTSEKEMSSSQLKLCPLADAGLGPIAWEQVSHLVFGFVSQDDYRRGVDEYDEKVFVSFKLILRELRNIYVSGI